MAFRLISFSHPTVSKPIYLIPSPRADDQRLLIAHPSQVVLWKPHRLRSKVTRKSFRSKDRCLQLLRAQMITYPVVLNLGREETELDNLDHDVFDLFSC